MDETMTENSRDTRLRVFPCPQGSVNEAELVYALRGYVFSNLNFDVF
jgi:hypothetical protein